MKVLTFLLVWFFYIGIGVGIAILVSILVSAIYKEVLLEEDVGFIILSWPLVILFMFVVGFFVLPTKFVHKIIKLIVNQEEQNED